MFKRISEIGDPIRFTFNGTAITCERGDTISAALLAAGVGVFRQTLVSGAPRGPFCQMGTCFDCLVEIDGASVQACMTLATDGMVVFSSGGPEGEA